MRSDGETGTEARLALCECVGSGTALMSKKDATHTLDEANFIFGSHYLRPRWLHSTLQPHTDSPRQVLLGAAEWA